MRIYFVRHAESELNTTNIVQGPKMLIKLSERGKKQADLVASALAEVQFDHAYVSPLERTQHTAEAILQHHPNTPATTAPELIEKDTGIYAGGPAEAYMQAWQTSGKSFGEFQPEGGESWFQAGQRVVGFVERLIGKHKGTDTTILLVSHGSVGTYLLMWADGFDIAAHDKASYDHYHPANTSITVIEADHQGKVVLASFNDTGHLESM